MSPASGGPPGHTIAAWWRQLAPLQPRRLWLVDWLVHHLEVLARCSRPSLLEPLQRILLGALDLGPIDSSRLGQRLGQPNALASRLLAELADAKLAVGTA